jgi:antitoxin PrlF
MLHSTITQKGQTTIPSEIRTLLGMKAGDVLAYAVEGNEVRVRVHPGTKPLKGIMKSKKGWNLSFNSIRKEAAKNALKRYS